MSQNRTQFAVLPNEIVYYIFNFLTESDILRSFVQLNRRYDDLVRFYVTQIDLTDGWQGDYDQLQWICKTIETLKIDQNHLYYLNKYQFSQLHSLSLIDVEDWQNVVSRMNLKNLSLWWDEDINYHCKKQVVPDTVVRFSTNKMFDAASFHPNLVHLSVCVRSMIQVIEIVQRTPKVQHLCVSFGIPFEHHVYIENDQISRFEALASSFRCLTNLQHLSFSTCVKNTSFYYVNYSPTNIHLPFNQIQVFIDRCCPGKQILKRIAFKFDLINHNDDLWSALERYKNTYDRFEFYISLIIEDKTPNIIKIPSTINPIGSHTEGIDVSHPQGRVLHVYSLPFTFNELNGFVSYSELNAQSSFSSVRHLYFTRHPLSRPVSFQSLGVHMPQLTAITCDLSFDNSNISDSEITVDPDVFYHVRYLHFVIDCSTEYSDCHNLLSKLLDRMPRLQKLIPFSDHLSNAFSHQRHPLLSIRLLDLRQSYAASLDILPQHLPHLSTLLLSCMPPNDEKISQIIGTLFIKIPSLILVSYRIIRGCGQDRTPYEEIAETALTRMKSMDNHLLNLSLCLISGIDAKFFRQIS